MTRPRTLARVLARVRTRLIGTGLAAILVTTAGITAGALAAATPAAAQPAAGQYYQLVAVHSGKAIQIDGSGTGAMAVQWDPTANTNQQFRFESSGSGYYRVIARHSGMALDVYGWNPDNGAEIRQWTDLNGTNQQWSIVDRGNSRISLVNRFSGKALDVWEWSTANGARLSQYDSTGGDNQRFQLVPVGGDPDPDPDPDQPVWQSCDQWGNWSTGGWTLYNNIWGSGAGSQCIWANSPTNWGVQANHPNTGGVKSYPNLTRWYGRQISQIGTASSSFNLTVPTSNVAYTSTFDIWSDDNAHEIMIWVNRYGPVGAIGAYETTVTLGGHTWDFYRGSHSGIQVYSFLRQGNLQSGTVDIGAVTQWLLSTGRIPNVTIGDVQFGFEITSAAGGQSFTVNSYSLTLN